MTSIDIVNSPERAIAAKRDTSYHKPRGGIALAISKDINEHYASMLFLPLSLPLLFSQKHILYTCHRQPKISRIGGPPPLSPRPVKYYF